LKPDSTGEYSIDRTKDVLFVVMTTPNLVFYNFDTSIKGP